MSKRSHLLLGMLGLLASSVACASEPGVEVLVLAIDSDLSVPAELDRVTVSVEGQVTEADANADLRDKPLPRSLTLVHESGPLGPVHITVRGWLGERALVRKDVVGWFRRDGEAQLAVALERTCVDVACAVGSTCERGTCVEVAEDMRGVDDAQVPRADARVTPQRDAELPPSDAADANVDPRDAAPGDAGGSGSPPDAGPHSTVDAATPVDAGDPQGPPDSGVIGPPPGNPPLCTIVRPRPGDAVQTRADLIVSGSCSDPETGAVTSGLGWTSQLDSTVAQGGMAVGRLRTAGTHQLSLCASDPRAPQLLGCATVSVLATNTAQPSAQILTISQGAGSLQPYVTGTTILLTGSGSGASVALSWRDSLQGPLGTGSSVSLVAPRAGRHTVTLTATDVDGNVQTASSTFYVITRPL